MLTVANGLGLYIKRVEITQDSDSGQDGEHDARRNNQAGYVMRHKKFLSYLQKAVFMQPFVL